MRDEDADRDADRRRQPAVVDGVLEEEHRRQHERDAGDRGEHLHADELFPIEPRRRCRRRRRRWRRHRWPRVLGFGGSIGGDRLPLERSRRHALRRGLGASRGGRRRRSRNNRRRNLNRWRRNVNRWRWNRGRRRFRGGRHRRGYRCRRRSRQRDDLLPDVTQPLGDFVERRLLAGDRRLEVVDPRPQLRLPQQRDNRQDERDRGQEQDERDHVSSTSACRGASDSNRGHECPRLHELSEGYLRLGTLSSPSFATMS